MLGIKNWKSSRYITPQRVGFVSTRFAGTDGVSLESSKWAEVLEEDEHQCFWYAGRLDKDDQVSLCIPEAFFGHPENLWINDRIWGRTARDPLVTERIHAMAGYLKSTLYDFIRRFDIKILVFENVLSIPMHIPLGVAIAELMSETHIPVHRTSPRFLLGTHAVFGQCRERSPRYGFPFPRSRSPARGHQRERAGGTGAPQIRVLHSYSRTFWISKIRRHRPTPMPPTCALKWALDPNDVMILQPTRVVPRKGIEHAINLVKMLGEPEV